VGILATTENDVIVTTASQISAAPAAQVISLTPANTSGNCLSHANLPPGLVTTLLTYFSGDSNASVTTSPTVDSDIEYVLLNGTTAGMTAALSQQLDASEAQQDQHIINPQETKESLAEMWKHPPTKAPERVKVIIPSLDVPLGVPLQITLQLAPGKLFCDIWVAETGRGSYEYEQGGGPAKIISDQGTTKVIEVMPLDLGPIDLKIAVIYADNADATQVLHLNVLPSAKGLRGKSFSLHGGGGTMVLVFEDQAKDRQEWLGPVFAFDGVKYPVFAFDATYIPITVEQPKDDPVIRVDKDGLVHALRPGNAVIVGNIDGVIDRVPVTVYSKESAPPDYRTVHEQTK
jgi:hypothetical protein